MPMKYESRDVETPIQVSLDDSIEHGIVVSNLAYNVGKELGLDEAVCYDLAVAWACCMTSESPAEFLHE